MTNVYLCAECGLTVDDERPVCPRHPDGSIEEHEIELDEPDEPEEDEMETTMQLARDRQQREWNNADLQIQNRYFVLAYWDHYVDGFDQGYFGPAFRETQTERQQREALYVRR